MRTYCGCRGYCVALEAVVRPQALSAHRLVASCAQVTSLALIASPAIALALAVDGVPPCIAGAILGQGNLLESHLTVSGTTFTKKRSAREQTGRLSVPPLEALMFHLEGKPDLKYGQMIKAIPDLYNQRIMNLLSIVCGKCFDLSCSDQRAPQFHRYGCQVALWQTRQAAAQAEGLA